MKDEEIYSIWTQFINDPKYSKYFKSYEESLERNFSKTYKIY